MRRFATTLILTFLSSYALGKAAVQTYEIRSFSPLNATETCKNRIQDVAEKFQQQTSKEIVHASCEKDRYTGESLNGIITYVSADKAAMTTTEDQGGSIFNVQGTYVDRASCQADLARSLEQFENVTGLPAIVSFCYERLDNYAVRIDAVGTSTMMPFTAGTNLMSTLTITDAEFIAELTAGVEAAGLIVRNIGLTRKYIDRRVSLLYYADKRYDLSDYSDIKFETLAQCNAQATNIRQMFSNEALRPAAVACSQDLGTNPFRVHIFTLGENAHAPNGFKRYAFPGAFVSEAECVAEIPRLTDALEQGGEESVIGGVCSGGAGDFKAYFFLRN